MAGASRSGDFEEASIGVDVWREFKQFDWGIVDILNFIVGGMVDGLEWLRGGRTRGVV